MNESKKRNEELLTPLSQDALAVIGARLLTLERQVESQQGTIDELQRALNERNAEVRKLSAEKQRLYDTGAFDDD